MVTRTLVIFDNENFVVQDSSSAAIIGNPVINNSSTPDGTTFVYNAGSGQTVTIDDTGGDPDVFEDDQAGAHQVVDGAGLVANGQNVEAESRIFLQALDSDGTPVGPPIVMTVFSQGGVTGDVWGLSTDTPLVDGVTYVKTGGSNVGTSSYADFITCFVTGTDIETPDGHRPVEDLKCGDLVITREGGAMPIRWMGQRSVLGAGAFAPVRIETGFMGAARPLAVSPEHRLLVSGPWVELLFGAYDVLVAAKELIGLPGITQQPQAEVTYCHLMLDSHQVLRSNGLWSESFFLSSNAMSGLAPGARSEMTALFGSQPEAETDFGAAAAMVLKSYEAQLLHAVLCTQLNAGDMQLRAA